MRGLLAPGPGPGTADPGTSSRSVSESEVSECAMFGGGSASSACTELEPISSISFLFLLLPRALVTAFFGSESDLSEDFSLEELKWNGFFGLGFGRTTESS